MKPFIIEKHIEDSEKFKSLREEEMEHVSGGKDDCGGSLKHTYTVDACGTKFDGCDL